jgi:hypothetical protein
MILDEARAIVEVAAWRALRHALDSYTDAVMAYQRIEWLSPDKEAAYERMQAARQEVARCWHLYFGRPLVLTNNL